MKLQHTNVPDQIGPGKSYIFVCRVIKTIKFSFSCFTISSRFLIQRKNILCSVTKCQCFKKKRGKTPRQICCINYFGWTLKIAKYQQEDTFKHYGYLEYQIIQRVKFERIRIKFGWKNSVKPCKLSYCNVSLVVTFRRFIGKSLE